jgi:hypothetical protein
MAEDSQDKGFTRYQQNHGKGVPEMMPKSTLSKEFGLKSSWDSSLVHT